MNATLIGTIIAIAGLIASFFLGRVMQNGKVSALVALVATLCDAIADGKIDNAEVQALTDKVVAALKSFGLPKGVAESTARSLKRSS